MKRGLILLIALLGSGYLGCRQDQNEVRPTTAQADPTASIDDTRDPVDGSGVVRPGNGAIIKKSGWQLPVTLPKEKQYHATAVVIEGRHVMVLNSPFFPEERLLVKFPKFAEDGEVEYKISQIIEFTDRRKKPYCYQFFASDDWPDAVDHPYVPTFLSYRDDDGDGIFETLGEGCKVPDWVK